MSKERGATLIEIVVVITIISIIFFQIPSLIKMVNYYRLNSYSKLMLMDIQFARRMANYHNKDVSICALGKNNSCKSTGDLNHWDNGWIIFYDNKHTFKANDSAVLRIRKLTEPSVKVQTDSNIQKAIRFSHNRKFGSTAGSGLPNGSISFCSKGQFRITIKINIFGNARIEKTNKPC